MPDEMIDLDSELGKKLGFTSDLFSGYLWLKDNDIWISLIDSLKPNEGNMTTLFNQIESLGYGIKVPIPLNKMKAILKKKGFVPIIERNNLTDEEINIWMKK